ncbi:MAG: hypothetical protein FOGNACKC_00866 [Anaerolineae bacterium]|nr:hypothetical protein [Anaerolineae bacterium]
MKITTEQIQEFMDMLTGGEVPEGMQMEDQPELSYKQAFSVIWYLQEHLRVLPDKFEMCDVCNTIFDNDSEGYIISDDSAEDDWYKEIGVSAEMVKAHEGARFCNEGCERRFWRNLRNNGNSSVWTYKVWNKAFYESASQVFPGEGDYHGEFKAKNETDLMYMLIEKGIDPALCAWEIELKGNG